MKLNIRGYEVEIKAKGAYSDKANKADTMALLNMLTCYCGTAEDGYKAHGMVALAKGARQTRDDIYNALDTVGYYDDLLK